jgi:uncharacterized phage protein (TIGR01671 family)
MREIKFRAWDRELKEWTNYSIDNVNDNLVDFYNKEAGLWESDREGERFVLSQYTGIKDISGVEIYEGDIFIARNSHNCKFKVIYDGSRFIGVNYDRERVCYVDSCYKNGSSRLEIIGNIYENPGLLEEVR